MFWKHSLRTVFDLLRNPTKGFVECRCKQAEQKQYHDHHSKLRSLFPGSLVKVRNYHGYTKWIPGAVLKKLGPVTYSVDIRDGRMVKRHTDQLCQGIHHSPKSTSNANDDYYYYELVTPVQDIDPVTQTPSPKPLQEERCYPQRQHCPPETFIHENY